MKNVKIFTKLIVSFLIVIIMTTVLGVVSMVNLQTISKYADDIYNHHLVGVKYLSSALESFEEIRISSLKVSVGAFLKDEELMNASKKEIQQNIDKTNEYFALFAESETIEEILNSLPTVITARDEYIESLEVFIGACDLVLAGDTSEYVMGFQGTAASTITIKNSLKETI